VDVQVGTINFLQLVENMKQDYPQHRDNDEGIQETENIWELRQSV
jgi:hypothetical protein